MERTIIIAEIGVNHNGSMELAEELIRTAAQCGADYAKFQSFKTKNLVQKGAKKANYQIKNSSNHQEDQYQMLKSLELQEKQYEFLQNCCSTYGIKFLSSPFDVESLLDLEKLNLDLIKIPSGEITNYPLLKKIGSLKRKTILSTGASNLEEIRNAVNVLIESGLTISLLTILHCNTEYPTPMKDVNLLAMVNIGKELGVNFGYSDHTLGIEVPIAAVALGAKVIEKHITLDRNLKGPDHSASIEPQELESMIQSIRNIELAIQGDGIKVASESEIQNRTIVRKSICLNKALKQNYKLKESDLTTLRPGNGICPMEWKKIIGKTLKNDFPKNHQLQYSDLL